MELRHLPYFVAVAERAAFLARRGGTEHRDADVLDIFSVMASVGPGHQGVDRVDEGQGGRAQRVSVARALIAP
jgi:ABC-type lipoprotein export system ATPase subunit